MPTFRDRASDALLHAAIDLGADREQLLRSLRGDHRNGCELAASTVVMAGWVDSALLWLSTRLRPGGAPALTRPATRTSRTR